MSKHVKVCNGVLCRQDDPNGVILPLTEFGIRKDTNKPRSLCKRCEAYHARQSYARNRDKRLAQKKEYQAANAERLQAYRTQRYQQNRTQALRYAAEYRAKNKAVILQRDSNYRNQNRTQIRAQKKFLYLQRKLDRLQRLRRAMKKLGLGGGR